MMDDMKTCNIKKSILYLQQGFTLVELLVVIAILGILAVFVASNFSSAQFKSRDAKRKNDLGQIQRAVEMYYNDSGEYPAATDKGQIENEKWGEEFSVESTMYMATLPLDPTTTHSYFYVSNGSSYAIYAAMEHENNAVGEYDYECIDGEASSCNYGVSSTNRLP